MRGCVVLSLVLVLVLTLPGCAKPRHHHIPHAGIKRPRKKTPVLIDGKPLQEWQADLRDPDPEVRMVTASALGDLGTEAHPAIPALCAMLGDTDLRVRESAAVALGQIGPPVVPVLRQALRDPNENVRRLAARALGDLRAEARDATPELIEALADRNALVRVLAADALARMGGEAVPALKEAQQDPRPMVSRAAAAALRQIDP